MEMYQNLLVVIDPDQNDQPALRRAAYLVKKNSGCIKAFLPIHDLPYDMTTPLSPDEITIMREGVISQRKEWISKQCHSYVNSGIKIEIKVVWHNRPYEAIIREILTAKHDLLLKMAHQHDRLESLIFTPIDWHLLRKCPCPVWMVKDQPWPKRRKAVVAVNLSSEEPYHDPLNIKPVNENDPLNIKLIHETLALAKRVDQAEVHLISAYPVTPINISIEIPNFDQNAYNDVIHERHLIAMTALRQKFNIDEKYTHVEKGLPEYVIPDLAEQLQAGVVILGTLGRTGISGAFIGNTAEHVIDHLKCDLLAIKPDGFICPIEHKDNADKPEPF